MVFDEQKEIHPCDSPEALECLRIEQEERQSITGQRIKGSSFMAKNS